eukprot:6284401-Prymnesium_polylepis.1
MQWATEKVHLSQGATATYDLRDGLVAKKIVVAKINRQHCGVIFEQCCQAFHCPRLLLQPFLEIPRVANVTQSVAQRPCVQSILEYTQKSPQAVAAS